MTMAAPSQKASKHLSPLNTSWHNRSMSSLSGTSDAATFHSAHAHHHSSNSNMELRPLSQPQSQSQQTSTIAMIKPLQSPKMEAVKMSRHDSGYSDTSQDRRSTSSARQVKRKTTASSGASSTRPGIKRASKSSGVIRTSTGNSRPSMQLRHTIPGATPYTQQQQPYEFFQFPTLPPNEPETITNPPPPPPPATVQYWTSDSTRRLEYAAIDAASNGVRGFFLKLVPDCIVPKASRRTRFCDGDEGSDAGSVRRYRLHLPEEKPCPFKGARRDGEGSGNGKRPRGGLFRRWSSFGKSRRD